MKMMKKAQTATEYLIILAVVIVIALVVASLLGAFPGIGGSTSGNANTGYWTTTNIRVDAATIRQIGNNANATLKISNGMSSDIILYDVTLDNVTNSTTAGVTLKPGKSTTIDFEFTGRDVSGSDVVSYPLSAIYEDPELGVNYTFEGDRNLDIRVSG